MNPETPLVFPVPNEIFVPTFSNVPQAALVKNRKTRKKLKTTTDRIELDRLVTECAHLLKDTGVTVDDIWRPYVQEKINKKIKKQKNSFRFLR